MQIQKTALLACLILLGTQAIAQSPPRLRTPFVEGWDQVPPEKLAQQASDFPATFFLEGPGERKEIALTYDNGPSADTPALLDVLKKHNVKATFFWLGNAIEQHPDIVKRAHAEGHTLANHSFSHPRLMKLEDGNNWWTYQIEKTQQAYQKVLGFQPSLMRPPYGFLSDAQVKFLAQKNMQAILWSVDSADWYHTHKNSVDDIASAKIEDVIKKYIHPEAIVLLHDAGGRGRKPSIMATERLIPELKQQGYRFTTVDQLLNIPAKLAPSKISQSLSMTDTMRLFLTAANQPHSAESETIWAKILDPQVQIQNQDQTLNGIAAVSAFFKTLQQQSPGLQLEQSQFHTLNDQLMFNWRAMFKDQEVAKGVSIGQFNAAGQIIKLSAFNNAKLE